MTTREDRRFTAAVACLNALLSDAKVFSSSSMVITAVGIADKLLARLDETAPPVADDKKCEHKRMSDTELPRCLDCGVGP